MVSARSSGAPEAVWLASYPKSGNTWLRFVLSDILLGGFERSIAIFEGTPLETCPTDLLRTDRVNFVKTHCAAENARMEGVRFRAAVLVVRNPLDVMMSNLRYHFLTGGGLPEDPTEVQARVRDYLQSFASHGGDPRWRTLGFGTWSEHTESWLDHPELPVVAIRYEDMRTDMVRAVERVLELGEIEVPRGRIARAVEHWSFDRMRQLEEAEIAGAVEGMFVRPGYERAHRQGLRFVGSRGSPLEGARVDPAVAPILARGFEPAFGRLGYTANRAA